MIVELLLFFLLLVKKNNKKKKKKKKKKEPETAFSSFFLLLLSIGFDRNLFINIYTVHWMYDNLRINIKYFFFSLKDMKNSSLVIFMFVCATS